MSDVFISYSRRNSDFARNLAARLRQSGKESWVDWEGIPLSSPNWWSEIKTGIENADSFVFIMSPDSMASIVCNMELDYALDLHKRMVIVVHQDVEMSEAFGSLADYVPDDAMKERLGSDDPLMLARENWTRISHINWLFFRETDDFEAIYKDLIETVETDLDYVKSHTRYLARAREWQDNAQRVDLLLFGDEINIAEEWLAKANGYARQAQSKTSTSKINVVNPLPDDLHRMYITNSREAETKRQNTLSNLRRTGMIAGAVGIIAIIASIFAFMQAVNAGNQSATATVGQGIAIIEQASATYGQGQAIEQQNTAIAEQETAIVGQALAVEQQETAVAQQITATVGQGQAIEQQNTAVAQQETAIAQQITATVGQGEAIQLQATSEQRVVVLNTEVPATLNAVSTEVQNAQNFADSVRLAAQAQQIYEADGNQPLGLSLALEATYIDTPPITQQIFMNLAYLPNARQGYIGHSDWVTDIDFHPDGTLIVTSSGDASVVIWDTFTGEIVNELLGHEDFINSVEFSPDGKQIVSTSDDETAILWDTETGEIIERFTEHENVVWDAIFSPDGQSVVSVGEDGRAFIWDVDSADIIQEIDNDDIPIRSVAFSPNASIIAIGDVNGLVATYNAEDGDYIQDFNAHEFEITSIDFSPDSASLITTAESSFILLWDVESADILAEFEGHSSAVRSAEFSYDGQLIVSGSTDQTVILWDVESRSIIQRFEGHTSWVTQTIFSPDDNYIVSSGEDNVALLWDINRNDILFQLEETTVEALAVSPDEQQAVSEIDDGILLINLNTGEIIRELGEVGTNIYNIEWSADGRYILAGGESGEVFAWDLDNEDTLIEIFEHDALVANVAISPDSQQAVSVDDIGLLIVADIATGDLIFDIEFEATLSSLSYSISGEEILVGDFEGTIYIIDANTGDILQDFTDHVSEILAIAVNPDGSLIATGGEDRRIILRDNSTGEIVTIFNGHNGSVLDLDFSSDGQYLVSGSADRQIIVWDVMTGDIIRKFTGHTGRVFNVEFFNDDTRIISGSADLSTYVWRLDSLAEAQAWVIENRYLPNLSCTERISFGLSECSND